MNFRQPATLIGLLAAGFAYAQYPSFDMAFVLDRGTNSVHRFDARTGTHFGQIGVGAFGDPQSMAYDRASSTLYVEHVLPFGTSGDLRRVTTGINPFTGDVTFNRMNFGTSVLRTGTAGSLNPIALASRVSGNRLVVERWSGSNLDSFFDASPVGLPGGFDAITDLTYQSSSFGGLYAIVDNTTYRYELATDIWSDFFPLPATKVQGTHCINGNTRRSCFPSGEANTTYSEFENILGYSQGHTYNYALGTREDGTATIQRSIRSTPFNFPLSTFGDQYLIDPIGIEIHAAPEPTTLAVMGLGAAALAWRRRRSKNS